MVRSLAADHVSKRFRGVTALRDVSVHVKEHEVLGLVGENGAGKSTLLSVLSGSLNPDEGAVRVDGKAVAFHGFLDANRQGIFRAHQDLALIQGLTVAENVYLGHERQFSRLGALKRRAMAAA